MTQKIKLLFLITIIGLVTSSVAYGQSNFNEMFIGYWTIDDSTVKTVIFKDKNNHVQMVMWDSSDGEEMEIVQLQVVGDVIQTIEKMGSTNWITYNTYSIIDENTLKCVFDNDDESGIVIYFERLK